MKLLGDLGIASSLFADEGDDDVVDRGGESCRVVFDEGLQRIEPADPDVHLVVADLLDCCDETPGLLPRFSAGQLLLDSGDLSFHRCDAPTGQPGEPRSRDDERELGH